MSLPPLNETLIRQHASAESFERGRDYYQQGAVLSLVLRGMVLTAQVEGSDRVPYVVRCTFDANGIAEAVCTCPYDWGGWCKHIVATCLAYIHHPEKVEERPPLDTL